MCGNKIGPRTVSVSRNSELYTLKGISSMFSRFRFYVAVGGGDTKTRPERLRAGFWQFSAEKILLERPACGDSRATDRIIRATQDTPLTSSSLSAPLPLFVSHIMDVLGDATTPALSSPKRHETLWLSDGNVILATKTLLFCVHKSVLAMRSSVFKDMFGLSSASDGDSEVIGIVPELCEGIPMVSLEDEGKDVEHLLKTIYEARCAISPSFPLLLLIRRLFLKVLQYSRRPPYRRQSLRLAKAKQQVQFPGRPNRRYRTHFAYLPNATSRIRSNLRRPSFQV